MKKTIWKIWLFIYFFWAVFILLGVFVRTILEPDFFVFLTIPMMMTSVHLARKAIKEQ